MCGAAVRKREGMAVHCGGDEGLWPALLPVVAVPFFVAGTVMLDLCRTNKK